MLPVKYSVMTLEINSWWQILWEDSKLLSPTQDLAFHSRLPAQQLASRKISETWDSGYKKVIIVLWCFKKAKHNTLMETAQPARNMLVPVTINSSSNCFYCYFISLGIVSTMLSVAFGKKTISGYHRQRDKLLVDVTLTVAVALKDFIAAMSPPRDGFKNFWRVWIVYKPKHEAYEQQHNAHDTRSYNFNVIKIK